MALPVLDGNQSATTLSSVVTGGEHIVAHSVVSLGTTAISNIATAVSGVSISISGTPSTTFGAVTGSVSILGTPTVTIPGLAHLGNSVATDGVADATTNFIKIGGHQSGQNQTSHIVHVSAGGSMSVDASGSSVTFSQASVTFGAIRGTVTIGNSVTISNFPSTQTIAGTVTANVPVLTVATQGTFALASPIQTAIGVFNTGNPQQVLGVFGVEENEGEGISAFVSVRNPISGTVTANGGNFVFSESEDTSSAKGVLIGFEDDASTEYRKVTDAQPLPISISAINNTGGFSGSLPVSGTVTVSNSVTIGSLPAISGTVTIGAIGGAVTIPVRLFAELEGGPSSGQDTLLQCNASGSLNVALPSAGGTNAIQYDGTNSYVNVRQVSTVTARLQDGSGNNLTSTSIGGVQRLNVSLASAATPGGTLPSFVNVYGGSDGSAVRTISVDSSGRQNINAQFPRVTLIDGSGTVATANTAITVFASSSTRSYLLVQVTTGSAFVNVGATATTVNGINLTAGQGYSWETTIPQGIVSLISTTTSSRYVAKEA